MNYTDKYHLPQWEETDRIMRADFNQMCADMEAGLEKNAQAAAGALSAANSKQGAVYRRSGPQGCQRSILARFQALRHRDLYWAGAGYRLRRAAGLPALVRHHHLAGDLRV